MYYNVFGEKVSRRRFKEMCDAAKNRRELIAAGLTSRRDLFKMGLLTAGGMLVAKSGLSARAQTTVQTNKPPSSGSQHAAQGRTRTACPATRRRARGPEPFIDPLPIMPLAQDSSRAQSRADRKSEHGAGEVRAAAFQAPLIDPARFPVVPGTLYNFNQRQFTARQTSDPALPRRPSGVSTTAPARAARARPTRPSTASRSSRAISTRCRRSRRKTTPVSACRR